MNKEVSSHKKDFLIVSLVLIAIGFMVFVLAAQVATFDSLVGYGNYSGTLNFTCISGMEYAINASLFYNASGGAFDTFLANVSNSSDNQSVFKNFEVDISGLDDGINYNFTCVMTNNGSATTFYSPAISNITIDNTAPNVSNFYTTTNNGNYSGTIVLNVSADDVTIGMGAVYFNITFANCTLVAGNFTEASNPSSLYYNITLITTGFQDGKYNITIYANDSAGAVLKNGSETVTNLNSTEHIQITIDNTAPSSVTLTSANNSRSSITATIAIVDATTGISGTCTVDRTKATVTGTGTSQILREDNLVCGQSYPYIVTCTDYTSHSKSSSTTTFSTDACSGGGTSSGSGATATYTWTNTYTTTDTQFTEGFTKQLSVNNRVRVTVSGLSHHVGVKEVTATSATIEIASEPVEVNLDVGEDAKVDVTDNGYYDIYVKLNAIVDGKADVTVMKINEEIPEGEGSVDTSGDVTGDTTTPDAGEETPDEEKGLTWLWIIIGILVLAAIVGGGVAVKKKQ